MTFDQTGGKPMKWETGYYVNGHLGQYAMGEMLKVADEFCASMG